MGVESGGGAGRHLLEGGECRMSGRSAVQVRSPLGPSLPCLAACWRGLLIKLTLKRTAI